MPTYEYACSFCDATHEVQQKMTDPTLTACPVCGQPGVRKLFSGVGIHFKGSGFYRTDSRDAKATASGDKASGDKASSDKGSGDKGSGDKPAKESTPAAAPAAGSSKGSSSASTSSSSTPAAPSTS